MYLRKQNLHFMHSSAIKHMNVRIIDDNGNDGDEDDDDDADDDDAEPIVKKIKFASPHDMKSDIIEVQQIPSVNPNDPPFYTSVMKVPLPNCAVTMNGQFY